MENATKKNICPVCEKETTDDLSGITHACRKCSGLLTMFASREGAEERW